MSVLRDKAKENPGLAKIGMTLHQQIYAVEDMIKAEEKSMGRKMTSEEKVQFRNDNAKPLWTNLKLWCEKGIREMVMGKQAQKRFTQASS